MKSTTAQHKKERIEPIISLRARDGTLVESILDPVKVQTALVRIVDNEVEQHQSLVNDGTRYVPFSPCNNLLTRQVILLPSSISSYGTHEELVEHVRAFIHRYIDLDPTFEDIAAHYVLLTWGYDVFNELPYLRVRGDYGCGKSRFLLTIGSLCYKPIFASGASTVSPIFRLIDQIGGTLIVDEADFWASDERAEIIKILNNGNARGFPVLRSEVTPNKEFNPRAFNIYGPKIIATRHEFQDEALESRCLTQELGKRRLRADIPISLPKGFHDEALLLRNKLLQYRFDRFTSLEEPPLVSDLDLSPRRAQVLAPLLRVATGAEARRRIVAFVGGTVPATGHEVAERRVLAVLEAMIQERGQVLGLAEIARRFSERWPEYGDEISPRWIGVILRRLGLTPKKSNGVFVLTSTDYPQLQNLIADRLREFGDERDIVSHIHR